MSGKELCFFLALGTVLCFISIVLILNPTCWCFNCYWVSSAYTESRSSQLLITPCHKKLEGDITRTAYPNCQRDVLWATTLCITVFVYSVIVLNILLCIFCYHCYYYQFLFCPIRIIFISTDNFYLFLVLSPIPGESKWLCGAWLPAGLNQNSSSGARPTWGLKGCDNDRSDQSMLK